MTKAEVIKALEFANDDQIISVLTGVNTLQLKKMYSMIKSILGSRK